MKQGESHRGHIDEVRDLEPLSEDRPHRHWCRRRGAPVSEVVAAVEPERKLFEEAKVRE